MKRREPYIGSVLFFRHLILAGYAALVLIPLVAATILYSLYDGEKRKNTELQQKISTLESEDVSSKSENTEKIKSESSSSDTKPPFLSTTSDTDKTETPDNTATEPLSSPYSAIYPELIAEFKTQEYVDDTDAAYLTFDDGPSSYTLEFLKMLRANDVKATFFVVPKDTPESKKILKQIVDEGHTIGIHTSSHEYKKIYKSVEAYLDDFKLAYDIVYEATGVRTGYFRFPGGSVNDYNIDIYDELVTEMTRRGFRYFDWNVDSGDAAGAKWQESFDNCKTAITQKRSVILFHDTKAATLWVLEDVIEFMKRNGKRLLPITETVRPMMF